MIRRVVSTNSYCNTRWVVSVSLSKCKTPETKMVVRLTVYPLFDYQLWNCHVANAFCLPKNNNLVVPVSFKLAQTVRCKNEKRSRKSFFTATPTLMKCGDWHRTHDRRSDSTRVLIFLMDVSWRSLQDEFAEKVARCDNGTSFITYLHPSLPISA